MSLSWARSIQSMPLHHTSRRSVLILSSLLRLGLPSGLFPSGFPTKSCIHLSSPSYLLRAPFTSLFLILAPEQYLVWSTGHEGHHYVVFSTPFLGPNILLSTLFSNTLSLRPSLNVRDQDSHPYKTVGKIIVLYISILYFWMVNMKTVDSEPNGSKHSLAKIRIQSKLKTKFVAIGFWATASACQHAVAHTMLRSKCLHTKESSGKRACISPIHRYTSMISGSLSPRHGEYSDYGRRNGLNMDGSCKYIERSAADSRQGVVLQLGCRARC